MPFKGWVPSEETRRKWSVARKGRKKPSITIDPKKRIMDGCDSSNGPNSCWNWTKSCFSDGYGQISLERKNWKAHRLSWTLFNGPIPEGKYVCHKCDNKKCINPRHMFLGTHKDNMDDMRSKGRDNFAKGERTGSAKLTEKQVLEIRDLWATGNWRIVDLCRKYNMTHVPIMCIVNRKTWKHI